MNSQRVSCRYLPHIMSYPNCKRLWLGTSRYVERANLNTDLIRLTTSLLVIHNHVLTHPLSFLEGHSSILEVGWSEYQPWNEMFESNLSSEHSMWNLLVRNDHSPFEIVYYCMVQWDGVPYWKIVFETVSLLTGLNSYRYSDKLILTFHE